jgi:HEAT repeat protein
MSGELAKRLEELFDAERAVRSAHAQLSEAPQEALLDVLTSALAAALSEADDEEATLRLVRIAALLGELEGPRVVDALIDVLAAEQPEARHAAGEEIEALAFDRFREVAEGVERALARLPHGSAALPELPFILAEVPEPGVTKLLGRFLAHSDSDAVAAAIEALVEIGDPASARLIAPLVNDPRTVEMADEEDDAEAAEITVGELAAEALSLLGDGGGGDGGGGSGGAPTPRRGGAS